VLAPQYRFAPIARQVLDVGTTLESGQLFLYERLTEQEWLIGLEEGTFQLRQTDEGLYWATDPPENWSLVAHFFSLDVDLSVLQRQWLEKDPTFAECLAVSPGLRIMRQTAEAALVQFVCTSCNNVPRIAGMLRSLAQALGTTIETPWGGKCYRVPRLDEIAALTASDLRHLGFGYRGEFLSTIARLRPRLAKLANLETEEARARLMDLPGVGPKVADCVCLFGLGRFEVVPVDTHVRRYATRRFCAPLADAALTPKRYQAIADGFRGIMGDYAGWAQQYVYAWSRRQPRTRRGTR